ncbi:unnamed protein product [Spirodela intermedia]|uniref:Uncharacterized protein n=1 Tax=Spirodela intermedia TaxID=51605 RepID=A0A7I8KKI3_SPIIN|nr:unnamed protein product [Spirodela intermedia]
MTFDQTSLTIDNSDRGMGREEARRACVPSVEEARSEVRLVEVEASVSLAWQRMSHSTSVKVTWKPRAGAQVARTDEGTCVSLPFHVTGSQPAVGQGVNRWIIGENLVNAICKALLLKLLNNSR